MEKRDYLDIVHRNVRDVLKARTENLKDGKVYETDDFLLVSSGSNSSDGHLNACLPLNNKEAKKIFKEAENFFNDLAFDYAYWIREEIDKDLEKILLENNFLLQRVPGSYIMIKEERIENAPLPKGYVIKEVESQEDIDGFAQVIRESFKKDDASIKALFSSSKTLISDNVVSYIVYNDKNKAVSGVILSISKDSAGLYFVGTIEEERGKGLGKAIVRVATNKGFDLGKDIVILQASKYGKVIYDQLDYKTIGLYKPYARKNTLQNTEG